MNDFSTLRPTHPDLPFLLAADIDGTLLGDELGESWLKAFTKEYASTFRLAYVTGRYRFSVLQLVEAGRLPRPDYICSDVGTELFNLHDPQNTLGQKFWSQVTPEWDLEAIYTRGAGEGVWRQDFGERQPPFQAGFFWDGNPTASVFTTAAPCAKSRQQSWRNLAWTSLQTPSWANSALATSR